MVVVLLLKEDLGRRGVPDDDEISRRQVVSAERVPMLERAQMDAAARRRCHKYVYDYIAGGADDESALKNNRESFRRMYDAFPACSTARGPEKRVHENADFRDS